MQKRKSSSAVSSQKTILKFEKISLSYGSLTVLNQASLEAKTGEVVAIVGASGAGKSSLLMIAGGLERPSHGTAMIEGESLKEKSEDELALLRREKVGIVFQAFHLNPSLTAQENVAVPLELAKQKDALKRAQESLTILGLGDRLDHYPAQLSGGEQQRVGVARAFINNPSLILADEPTGNLDAATGKIVIDQLFDASRRRNCSVLMVTHDTEIAKKCDRILRIKNGKIAA